jgi:hypothetical protein
MIIKGPSEKACRTAVVAEAFRDACTSVRIIIRNGRHRLVR